MDGWMDIWNKILQFIRLSGAKKKCQKTSTSGFCRCQSACICNKIGSTACNHLFSCGLSWFPHLDVDPRGVGWQRAVCSKARDELGEATVWVTFHEQDETSQGHEHARRDSNGFEERSPTPSPFVWEDGRHMDFRRSGNYGSNNFWLIHASKNVAQYPLITCK